MDFETHRWHSPRLGQEMELRVYGHAGKPVLVFPSARGRFYDYQDFGMVDAVSGFLEGGAIALVTVDSVDAQSWLNASVHPAERARRHQDYDGYVMAEVAPFIRSRFPGSSGVLATGCSMGAYHAVNFFFRHPDVFDAVIALSGVYQLGEFLGGYMDENVYFNTPLAYLPNLEDPWYLERYRRSQIVVCTGQGAWEEPMVADTRALEAVLRQKSIPAWIDLWGHDVNHDWPWWRKMMPYFLSRLSL